MSAPYRPTLFRLDLGLPSRTIFLKLETLSPVGAFKLRQALNDLLSRETHALGNEVATASSCNMAWAANKLGAPMAVHVCRGAAG